MTTITTATISQLMSGGGKDSASSTTIAASIGTSTRPYQSVQQLQSIRSTNKSIVRDIVLSNGNNNNNTLNDPSEERYWIEKFGLGTNAAQLKQYDNSKSKQFAHPRHVVLHVGTSSIVHQIIINTTAIAPVDNVMYNHDGTNTTSSTSAATTATTTTSNTSHYSKHTFMVGVCGPRVPIYGTTPSSKIHRTLLSHNHSSSTIASAASKPNIIEPDRFIPMNGQLALCASVRNDGRLLAIGTIYGTIRITDTTTRMILCQYGATNTTTNNNTPNNTTAKQAIAPLPIRFVQWFRNGQYIICMGDDAIVRVWKLGANTGATSRSQNQPILSCSGHGDVIRCGALYQQPVIRTTTTTTTTTKNTSISSDIALHVQQNQPISIAASGSYDHTIRIWNVSQLEDVEQNGQGDGSTIDEQRCLHVLYHGGPVEALLFIKSSSSNSTSSSKESSTTISRKKAPPMVYLIGAGGTNVKVWDAYNGTELHTIQLHHRKTITCMIAVPRIRSSSSSSSSSNSDQTNSNNNLRIVTGGLDGLMRVHKFNTSTGELQFVHGIHITLPDPLTTSKSTTLSASKATGSTTTAITSLAATAIGDRIAIGTANGLILVCQKGIPIQPLKRTSATESAGTYSFFTRGMNVDPSSNDTIVITNTNNNNKKRKLANYDVAMKQFRYSNALDDALNTRIPRIVVAVLEELGKRNGLTIALSNRNDESLEPILSFLVRYITRPRYSQLLIGVTNIVITIYKEVSGQSEMIDELFMKLYNQIIDEIRIQKNLYRVVGQLDAAISNRTNR